MAEPVCWIVTDGKIGMETQCRGLAEALGLVPVFKRVRLQSPWRQLSPYLRIGKRFAAGPSGDRIVPPWPDLVIASGRSSILPALAIKAGSGGKAFIVQIQDPVISPGHFDLVVVPEHDRVRGPNVRVISGSVSRINASVLAAAKAIWEPRLAHLPKPRVAVLIGGSNSAYRLTPAIIAGLADHLTRLCADYGAGLMVTPSRRTGTENEALLRRRLDGLPAVIWDGTGENPYDGFLALADAVIVTVDSINMTTESIATGKPVYTVDLEGGAAKFQAFQQRLRDAGVTRPFAGSLEAWTYPQRDDLSKIAAEIRQGLSTRGLVWSEPTAAD